MFYNEISGHEYTGGNVAILASEGFEEGHTFITFKQAIKLPGMSGKKMKGLKKAATLMIIKSKKDPETGEIKKLPSYFTVFDFQLVKARIESKMFQEANQ